MVHENNSGSCFRGGSGQDNSALHKSLGTESEEGGYGEFIV